MKKNNDSMNADYDEDKIIITLPLNDESLLDAHGFMMERKQGTKKTEPALSAEEEHRPT